MSALFALVAAFGWGSSDFAAGYASRKSSATSVVILTHLASVIALLVVAVRFGSGGFSIDGAPTAADIVWGLAAGIAGGAGAMLLFQGLGKGSMAVVAPITATGAASIPVLFGIATGDPLTVLGVLGIALALVAIVLVSLTGGDDGALLDTELDDDATDDSGDELLVPDGWSEEFRLPAPQGAPVAPPPGSGAHGASFGTPGTGQMLPMPGQILTAAQAVATSGPLASTPARALAPVAQASTTPVTRSALGVHNGELRMSLQTVRQAVLALVVAALLSSGTIAARPMGLMLDGEQWSTSIALQLMVALAIVSLAAVALHNVRPLFDFSQRHRAVAPPTPESASSPTATTTAKTVGAAASTTSLSWRSIIRQPGVTEALFSGLGFGLFFVFIYRASELAGHWPLVSARGISVVMFTLIALAGSSAVLPERGSRLPVILAGLLDAGAAIFFVMSTRIGLLSIGAVLAALYPVVTVLLARIITKEKIRRQQMLGLGLALCAVGLLAA